ncbi:hypothetical protein HPB51_005765 [Rhipicephalus microplus]|uniref:Uncharacterized protein n=1 Tax=Rhipicephalus microplus TaxID=6941 RepID=A0A9J6DTK0_RHIMP|nr:hypothetical protein HPB51_005765 [Rhipicephalus microplus]
MTWGTRSLVRNAAAMLLLHMALSSARASEAITKSAESNDAADRLRRDSDQIFIEHVKGVDDSQVTLSLFIGLLILGAVVVVVLIFLGCLLLVRLSESSCSGGPRYHRLLSSQETSSHHHHSRSCGGRSQVFTYVDMTNADGSCHEHRQLAPRFLAMFNTTTNVDVSDTDLCREHRKKYIMPETRKSHVVSTSHPLRDVKFSVRRARSEDIGGSGTFSDKKVAAADRTSEPPEKRICVQHISGEPKYHSGSAHDENGSDNYGERIVDVVSDDPQMEISVRDRFVKARSHGDRSSSHGSPLRRDTTHTIDQSAHSEINRMNSAQHTEQSNGYLYLPDLTKGHASGVNSVESSSPWLRSPSGSWSSPPLFANNLPVFTAHDRSPEHALRSNQNSTAFSGHGRSYEQYVPDGRRDIAAGPCANSRLECVGGSPNAQRDNSSTASVQTEFSQHKQELKNGPGPGIVALKADNVPDSTSETMRNRTEHETSKGKHSITSTDVPVEVRQPPTAIKARVSFQEMPSHQVNGTDMHNSVELKKLIARGPEMTTNLEHPETPAMFRDIFDENTTSSVLSETQSKASPKGPLPPHSPISSTKVNKQLRLPQPPRERHDKEVQTDLQGSRSTSKRRHARRYRRVGRTSGELVVVEEPDDEKAPEKCQLPVYDVADAHTERTSESPQPKTWLVPYDSPPLSYSPPATHDKSLVPSYNHGELTTTDVSSASLDQHIANREECGSIAQQEKNIYTKPDDEYIRPTDRVTAKEEASMSGPFSVVVAEDRPVQTYERSIAVMTDSPADEVDEHGENENSKALSIESASESSLQVKHAEGKESATVENESDKDECTLVSIEPPNNVRNKLIERPQPLTTELEGGKTVESRVRPKWEPAERTSRELVSSNQSSQQVATLSDRLLAPPVSQHPLATVDGTHPVPSQAHDQALVFSSPDLAQRDGTIAMVDTGKTSVVEGSEQSADDTRTLAASGGREVDISPYPDISKRDNSAVAVESPAQKISVMTPGGPPASTRADGSSSSEVKERTESTEVFFTPTSPVAAQGSKDLISFTNEPLDGPSAVNSAGKPD